MDILKTDKDKILFLKLDKTYEENDYEYVENSWGFVEHMVYNHLPDFGFNNDLYFTTDQAVFFQYNDMDTESIKTVYVYDDYESFEIMYEYIKKHHS